MTVVIVITVVAVLALALGVGVWVGLALYTAGIVGLALFRTCRSRSCCAAFLERGNDARVNRAADVHPDGGDPVPLEDVGLAVHGARALDHQGSRPPSPCECARLHHVCRDLRIIGCDGRDGRADHTHGALQAGIQQGPRHGLLGRCRDTWIPYPAISHSDHLRGFG